MALGLLAHVRRSAVCGAMIVIGNVTVSSSQERFGGRYAPRRGEPVSLVEDVNTDGLPLMQTCDRLRRSLRLFAHTVVESNSCILNPVLWMSSSAKNQ